MSMLIILSITSCRPINILEVGDEIKTISEAQYIDKVKGAWLGKMVGVSLGIPTEFVFSNRIGSVDEVPKWTPDTINEAYIEDDLYIPFAIMQTMKRRGLNAEPRQVAIDLYPYSFEFWGGHYWNFERGIAPPSSGHPSYANTPDSLSYSFAADYSGLIAPGLRHVPARLADRFARLLVYGDGVFGGAYIGAMYTEAFFTDDIMEVIEAGLSVIPSESWLHMAISDTLKWYEQNPDDFTVTWKNIMEKYFWNEEYNWIQWPYGGRIDGINLDTKVNCAFITMALLYGEGDPDKTLEIAIRSGADSDCNPSNALGILFTMAGYENVHDKFKRGLNKSAKFRYVDITFDEAVSMTVDLAKQVINAEGGEIKEKHGDVYFSIEQSDAPVMKYENSLTPEFMKTEYFTQIEMDQMYKPSLQDSGFEESWHVNLFSPWAAKTDKDSWIGVDLRQGKAYSGDNNAYIVNKGYSFAGIYQKRIKVEADSSYELSCYVRTSLNFDTGRLSVTKTEYDGSAMIADTKFTALKDYTKVSVIFDTKENEIVDINIGYYGNGDSTYIQVDDFSLIKMK